MSNYSKLQRSEEIRLLTGGIDSDNSAEFIAKDMLQNAVNVRATAGTEANGGAVHPIEGNTMILNTFMPGPAKVIGMCTDEPGQYQYFFLKIINPTAVNYQDSIWRFRKGATSAERILVESQVTGGLGFTLDSFISADVVGDQLFWAQAGQPVKYLNVANLPAGTVDGSYLSLGTEPGIVPLQASRGTDSTKSTEIQFQAFQFTYRIINSDNFPSTVAPYSLTVSPVRESDIAVSTFAGNTVDVVLPAIGKIPANWKKVQFIVRNLSDGDNVHSVIKEYNSSTPADATAVNNFNTGTALSFTGWTGAVLYTLDKTTVTTQANSVPTNASYLRLADNRLFLGNYTEGYDTPTISPGYSVTKNTLQLGYPNFNQYQIWVLLGQTKTQVEQMLYSGSGNYIKIVRWYLIYFIRFSGVNYIFKSVYGAQEFKAREFTKTSSTYTASIEGKANINEVIYEMPRYVALTDLIRANEQGDPNLSLLGPAHDGNDTGNEIEVRKNLINEALFRNEVSTDTPDWQNSEYGGSGYKNWWLLKDMTNNSSQNNINVSDTPFEFALDSTGRVFPDGTSYDLGIRYYDELNRTAGVQKLGSVNIGQNNITHIKSLSVAMNNSVTGAIPNWAVNYGAVISKPKEAVSIYTYVPDYIRVAVRNTAGDILLGGALWLYGYSGYQFYGLAIPISPLDRYKQGYTYSVGDKVIYDDNIGNTYSGVVLQDLYKGYLIVSVSASDFTKVGNYIATAATEQFTIDIEVVVPLVIPEAVVASFKLNGNPPGRQQVVRLSIFSGQQTDTNLYEEAQFGPILNPGGMSAAFGNIFGTAAPIATFTGPYFTQKRASPTGALTGWSVTPYEQEPIIPSQDYGRVALATELGQNSLPTGIKWSDTFIPGTQVNGYSTFQALNYKIVEPTAGAITGLVNTTRNITDGAQMLVLCTAKTFTALLGKAQISDADGNTAFVAASTVIGSINPISGGYGSQSPWGWDTWEGKVWWVDYLKRTAIEFGASGAQPISAFMNVRLWDRLLSQIDANPALVSSLRVSALPRFSEVYISVPFASSTAKAVLPTTTLENPVDPYYQSTPRAYIYNWSINKWTGSRETANKFYTIGRDSFSVSESTTVTPVYKEFTNSGTYNGAQKNSIIITPFNEKYKLTKSPLSLKLDTDRAPDECYVVCNGQVANVVTWKEREGDWMGAVSRDRTTGGGTTAAAWRMAGISGKTLKGKNVSVVLVYYGAQPFILRSASLVYSISSGH